MAREADARVTITTSIDAGVKALVQPECLYRALANVVRNAIRYAGSAGPIEISARQDRDQVLICVADRGPGLLLRSSDLTPLRTSIGSPWQNGTAERWVGSVRRELSTVLFRLNEYHLRRLGRTYIAYYHADRTHIALNKSTPAQRVVEHRSAGRSHLVCKPRLGGLHHRYNWSEAA